MVSRSRTSTLLATAIWLILAIAGMASLSVYESKAEPEIGAPKNWPSRATIARDNGYTLVLAVHPQCPCTAATVEELALLLARCPEMSVDVLFLQPKGFSENWTKSAFWKRIDEMPRTHCIIDPSGATASLFHAETSGQVALYSQAGELLFEGGLTAARGHGGDNIGVDSIVAIASHQSPATRHTNVFGCSLIDRTSVSNQ